MLRRMESRPIRTRRMILLLRIGFGVLLGLTQFLLIFLYLRISAPIVWGSTPFILIITLILILFFIFPAFASVRPGLRLKRAWVGAVNGTVIGAVGALTLLVIVVTVLTIAVVTAVPPTGTRIVIPARLVAAVLFAIALVVSLAGIVCAALGGWLGGAIGKLLAKWVKGE